MKKTEPEDYLDVTFLVRQALDSFTACLDKHKNLLHQGKALGAIAGMIQLSAIFMVGKEMESQLKTLVEIVAKKNKIEAKEVLDKVGKEFTAAIGKDLNEYN